MIESRPGLAFRDLDGEGGGEEEGAGWSSGYMMKPSLPGEDPAGKDSLRAEEGPTLNPSVVNLKADTFSLTMEATLRSTGTRPSPVIQGPREPRGLQRRSVKGAVRRGWGLSIPGTPSPTPWPSS